MLPLMVKILMIEIKKKKKLKERIYLAKNKTERKIQALYHIYGPFFLPKSN